jgi:putative SOS response-associated peptidase YedK
MCGRYDLSDGPAAIRAKFSVPVVPDFLGNPDLRPTDSAPIVRLDKGGARECVLARWGLVPFWAKDLKFGTRCINARAETIDEKNAFKDLLDAHRCLVPADGFYEWRHEGKQRLPHFIHRRDGGLLAMAGLWSRWRSPDGLDVDTFTIITTAANDDVRTLHERMPVFLDEAQRGVWMSDTRDRAALRQVLVAPQPGQLVLDAVGTHVNSSRSPWCAAPCSPACPSTSAPRSRATRRSCWMKPARAWWTARRASSGSAASGWLAATAIARKPRQNAS